MAVLISRSHLVTFRLSAEEFESLKATCTTEGARSLSDFARAAVLDRLRAHRSKKVTLGEDLATLSLHLSELDGALRDILLRISRVLGSANQSDSANVDWTTGT
jgi:hypothetical protein